MAEQVPKLGALITGEAERDAVHVAVVPAEACVNLKPGQHVGFGGTLGSGMLAVTDAAESIGIVDPFLRAPVKKGQRFYLFLYPGTVISLRHHYRHPVLDADEIRRETIERLNAPAVQRMKEWAKNFGITYREAMQHTDIYLLTGEEAVLDGFTSMNVSTDDYPKGGTFWGDYIQITGKEVPDEQKKDFFSCEC